VKVLRVVLLTGSLLGLLALMSRVGAEAAATVLATITWWEFALICAAHGVSVATETLGWRCTLTGDRPPFHRLLAAGCAGEAVNVLTAVGSVGGDATKVWLLRREIPYEASIPSLILAKTALVLGQVLLLAAGALVAWTTGIGGPAVPAVLGSLLVVEVIAIGGFIAVQHAGLVGKAGRVLSWAGIGRVDDAQRYDDALRGFYRRERRSFGLSVGIHFLAWLFGALEGLLILKSLDLPASLATATVVEAIGSGVRFLTFFVPASLGALEGGNAAVFAAFGWVASAGLAFTLVRRARQAVWIGLGLGILLAMSAAPVLAPARAAVGSVLSGLGRLTRAPRSAMPRPPG
jgi:glycosyltransferase 2 family protein